MYCCIASAFDTPCTLLQNIFFIESRASKKLLSKTFIGFKAEARTFAFAVLLLKEFVSGAFPSFACLKSPYSFTRAR